MVCLFQALIDICQTLFKFVILSYGRIAGWIFRFCPAVLPPYLALRLRSVTLRPTFSSGLPFSSSNWITAMSMPSN
jgi:hypothetical protein